MGKRCRFSVLCVAATAFLSGNASAKIIATVPLQLRIQPEGRGHRATIVGPAEVIKKVQACRQYEPIGQIDWDDPGNPYQFSTEVSARPDCADRALTHLYLDKGAYRVTFKELKQVGEEWTLTYQATGVAEAGEKDPTGGAGTCDVKPPEANAKTVNLPLEFAVRTKEECLEKFNTAIPVSGGRVDASAQADTTKYCERLFPDLSSTNSSTVVTGKESTSPVDRAIRDAYAKTGTPVDQASRTPASAPPTVVDASQVKAATDYASPSKTGYDVRTYANYTFANKGDCEASLRVLKGASISLSAAYPENMANVCRTAYGED